MLPLNPLDEALNKQKGNLLRTTTPNMSKVDASSLQAGTLLTLPEPVAKKV